MKIKVLKSEKEGIVARFVKESSETEFSNLELINYLYRNGDDIEFEFCGLSVDEEKKVRDLFRQINDKVLEAKSQKAIN